MISHLWNKDFQKKAFFHILVACNSYISTKGFGQMIFTQAVKLRKVDTVSTCLGLYFELWLSRPPRGILCVCKSVFFLDYLL